MKKIIKILAVLLIFVTSKTWATSLELDISGGSNANVQELIGSGDINERQKEEGNEKNKVPWNLNYTHTKSLSVEADGSNITDDTNEINLGLGMQLSNGFLFDVGYSYSTTPDENLKDSGPSLDIGYTYKFVNRDKKKEQSKVKNNNNDDNEDEDFTPEITFKLNAEKLNYVQTFGKASRKKVAVVRPTAGDNTIDQTSYGPSLEIRPLEWCSVKLTYNKYSYNKDVNTFLLYLDSSKAPPISSGMSNAIFGFNRDSLETDLDFYFLETWELDLSYTGGTLESDGSTTTLSKFLIQDDISKQWRLGLGGQKSTSNGATDNEGTIAVTYNF